MKESIPIGQAVAAMAESEEQKKLEHLYDNSPFLQLLEIKFKKIEQGVRLELEVVEKHANIYGIAHGAVLFALADTAMGWACHEAGLHVVTVDSSMNFLKPAAKGTRLHVTGEIIHAGRRLVVCEGRIYDEAGNLYLKAQGTFCVLQPGEAQA